jgi:hypothetical protein
MSFNTFTLCMRNEMMIQTLITLENLLNVLHVISLAQRKYLINRISN